MRCTIWIYLDKPFGWTFKDVTKDENLAEAYVKHLIDQGVTVQILKENPNVPSNFQIRPRSRVAAHRK